MDDWYLLRFERIISTSAVHILALKDATDKTRKDVFAAEIDLIACSLQ